MAHGHSFSSLSVVIKTPQGYLGRLGFIQDINSPDVLVVKAFFLGGKWASKRERIEKFKEQFNISIDIDENECEFFTFHYSDEDKSDLNKWY